MLFTNNHKMQIAAELAEKYINDHVNPIVKKVKSLDSKLFLSKLDDERLEKCLTEFETSFRHERVDRRIARCTAEWLPEQNIAKITKITKALASFGTQNKNGKFLNDEETLFLLETNKLELTYKTVPVSIEEAFKKISSFEKYLAYKQLALHGYKLKPFKTTNGGRKEPEGSKSHKETSDDGPPAKIAKLTDTEQDNMAQVFEKLRQNGPKVFQPKNTTIQPDYNVQMPNTTEKVEGFNLVVSTNQEFTTSVDEKNLNTYAVVADDNVAFYKFYNTNIPVL